MFILPLSPLAHRNLLRVHRLKKQPATASKQNNKWILLV